MIHTEVGNSAVTQHNVAFDNIASTLEISSPKVNGQYVATFTFSEAVTEFSLADITATGSINCQLVSDTQLRFTFAQFANGA